MALRRITQHIKEQNWFAFAIDFIIVVIGVAVAMMGQEWLSERNQRTNIVLAEQALQQDLFRNYFNAKERLAVSGCRIQAYQSISQKLLELGDEWVGMPRSTHKETDSLKTALPSLLRSPSRNWGSGNWKAELSRGTFKSMDINLRNNIDALFKQTERAQKLQTDIYTLQGQMKTLAFSTRIGQAERLKYLDRLGELDMKSSHLELSASQIVRSIENIGLKSPYEDISEFNENLPKLNAREKSIYGECFIPITMEYLTEQLESKSQPYST